MKEALRRMARISFVSASCLVAACGAKVLDWRNAEVSSGKIYTGGANSPFSGKVTNIPAYQLPLRGLEPFGEMIFNVTRLPRYAALSLAAKRLDGGSRSGLCDAMVKDGVLDGDLQCTIGGTLWLKLKYEAGVVDGKVTVFDQDQADKVLAEATLTQGQVNGQSTVYDPASGNVVHTVGWEKGILNGPEEVKDKTGNLLLRATLVDGKYEGKAERFDGKGNLVVTTFYKAGSAERNIRPGLSAIDNCVEDWAAALQTQWGGSATVTPDMKTRWRETCQHGQFWNSPESVGGAPSTTGSAPGACVQSWIVAFRKEKGQDAPVSRDQLGEWTDWCKQGRVPS